MAPQAPRPSPGSHAPPMSKEQFAAAKKLIEEKMADVQANADLLQERTKEWEDVKDLLRDLPEKVRHPIMVPFGKLAFFDGYLEHTNEVLTQLSSEWFALRTSKQAMAMADRRLAHLQRDADDVARELSELEQRRRVAAGAAGEEVEKHVTGSIRSVPSVPGAQIRTDEDGFIDIREPYNEKEEELFASIKKGVTASSSSAVPAGYGDAARRAEGGVPGASMRVDEDGYFDIREPYDENEEPSPSPLVGAVSSSTGAAGVGSMEDTLARLRELEGLEAMEESKPSIQNFPAVISSASATHEQSDVMARLMELERLEELEELDSIMESAEMAVDTHDDPECEMPSLPGMDLRSPADIFQFMNQIDEKAAALGNGQPLESAKDHGVAKLRGRENAFSGQICERKEETEDDAVGVMANSVPTNQPKRISKFKADRQRRG